MYKIGQTIPKTYPGGLRVDLLSYWYQRSLAVSEEESPPKINATKTNTNMEYLLLKNKLSFSKKPRNSS